jgi:CheY-like chemotaxis protein
MTTNAIAPKYIKSMGRKMRDPLKLRINWRYRSILIVDDVPANFEITRDALQSTKAKILHARNGMEAMSMCFTNKRIDLVIMEINLPGISGCTAAREIKFIRPDVLVIAQSALIPSITRSQVLEAGCDDFFIKPINSIELIALIRNCLVKNDKRV